MRYAISEVLLYVQCVRFVSGSKKLAFGSEDGTVAVREWEKSNSPILILEGHSDMVMSVAVSCDDVWILSGSWDGTVRVWNGSAGFQTGRFPQVSKVWCAAICADGRKSAKGMENGTMKVLDLHTEETLFEDTEAHADSVLSVAFSSNEQLIGSCSKDKTIRLRHPNTWAGIGSSVKGTQGG